MSLLSSTSIEIILLPRVWTFFCEIFANSKSFCANSKCLSSLSNLSFKLFKSLKSFLKKNYHKRIKSDLKITSNTSNSRKLKLINLSIDNFKNKIVLFLSNNKIESFGEATKKIAIKESKEIEIIIAISATLDGQTTAHYLSKVINRYGNKITKLAHGVPVGGELDYLDDGTIIQALKGRTLFE